MLLPTKKSCHLSRRLMWAFLIKICPLSVVVVAVVVVVNFSHFHLFCRTIGPISTKFGTKHPWVKWIQVCSNEGPRLCFSRGDNYKIAKIHWRNLKIPEQLSQFQPNLARCILGWRGFKFVQWRTLSFSKVR